MTIVEQLTPDEMLRTGEMQLAADKKFDPQAFMDVCSHRRQ